MRRFEIHEPDHVLFGPGAESRTAEALVDHGAERVLLVCMERFRDGADRIAAALGDRAVGVFTGVVPQVPRQAADEAIAMARDLGADWVLAHGGGSATGFAKAIALDVDVKVAAVPTTYAGSERTDIWGITADGEKTTGRDARVRPRLVVYDPDLLAALPREVTLLSLLNALAHSVEALYAETATAGARDAARRSLAPLLAGLRGLGRDLDDTDARAEALYGAYQAAEALGGASMALHHKLAHVLGGSFGTPHATTHATLLPHTMGFNLQAADEAREALGRAWGTDDPAAHLYDLMRDLGLSVKLADLGLSLDDLDRVADLAVQKRYPNPRPFDRDTLWAFLRDAWHARRPTRAHGRLDDLVPEGHHAGLPAATAGVPVEQAEVVVLGFHGRGAEPDRFLADLRRRAGDLADRVAWIAPQALANTWYPRPFRDPVEDNQPAMDGALGAVDAAWARALQHVPAERILLVGFSQGACLLTTWLLQRAVRPAGVLAFSGAHTPMPGQDADLSGVFVHMGISADDPYMSLATWEETRDALRGAGARVEATAVAGLSHGIHPFDAAALRRALERLVSDDLAYQTGFGNQLASEAVPGTLPTKQNTPQHAPGGLITEQLNGTGFTLERAHNLRTWMYRLRPAIHDRPFRPLEAPPPHFSADFADGVSLPEVQRYHPVDLPDGEVDWLDGVQTFAGAGDPAIKRGMAVHVFAASADMERVFCNIDGDLLLAPEVGTLRVQTELGWLQARPGEILILPRGLRFRITLPDGPTRGFAAELYDGHFQLPERGPIGANGLADPRHFRAPVAAYEDDRTDTTIVVKQGGRFWGTTAPASPFDVVAWHGNYTPYVYDLMDFHSLGSVSWDHPDPSILTVLTSPMDTHGRNAIDVGVFRGRWDATEGTFRPPYFHRNSAIEFNAVLKNTRPDGPYRPGTFSFTPYLTPHGISARGQQAELDRTDDSPTRLSDDSLWLQFESTYVLKVLPRWLDHDVRDTAFLENFTGWRLGDLVKED